MRWQQFLSRFDFKWEYRKGCANVADPIGRCPALMRNLTAWAPAGAEGVPGGLLQRISDGYGCDKWFDDVQNTASLLFSDGAWRKGSMIVVPDAGDLRQKCLSLHHDTPFSGHLGRDRTLQLVQQSFWWPALNSDVRQYVSSCDHCQKNRPPMQNLQGCCSLCLCLSSGGSG